MFLHLFILFEVDQYISSYKYTASSHLHWPAMGGAAFTALTEAVTLLNSLAQDIIIISFISIISVYPLSGKLKSLFTTAIGSSEKCALLLMYITFREC